MATHRVIALVARRYFRLPTPPLIATRRPASLVGRVILRSRPRAAVRLNAMAFSSFAIEVISCRLGPGDVPVTAEAYVVGEGVGAAREALVYVSWQNEE